MFKTNVKINFFDADPVGIMFFGNIFRFAQCALENFFENAGFEKECLYESDCIIPLIHTEADYKKPLLPGSTIQVSVAASVIKKSSFELTYEFWFKDELCAICKTVHVCLDKEKWTKRLLPEEMRDYLIQNSAV